LTGTWKVDFIEGGPVIPVSQETKKLVSWTELGGADTENFSGTAKYSLNFELPVVKTAGWILELGDVYNSARVRLNGKNIGILITPPYQIRVRNEIHQGMNTLEVEVSNLSANRARFLDRSGNKDWKTYYNIGFLSRDKVYDKIPGSNQFDATDWPVMTSGLLGPVRLIPLMEVAKN